MYYQYTGQPGHGKTVLAIEFALQMKERADKLHAEDPAKHPLRELYVCNVRDFNHGAAGALELTPDEVKTWHENPAFDHAILLVDEAYEHGMFPRRPPGRPIPEHVQQVAKHRHRGIDFIMVCQSPKKQMDDFLHDLIEEHYHIRRRFGLPLVHIKRWDKFEGNPDKAAALTTSRRKYPVHVFKLYTSTKYDTSEKRVPWFYFAAAALAVAVCFGAWFVLGRVDEAFTPKDHKVATTTQNGAAATVGGGGALGEKRSWETATDYAKAHLPRFGSMPWTAPIFDERSVTADPMIVCASSGGGIDAQGSYAEPSCTCLTEQGTLYDLSQPECRTVARRGAVYNPYKGRAEQQQGQQQDQPQPRSAANPVGSSVGYAPGQRADVFPLNPAKTIGGYTPPTTTL